jgi:hypothetical protein
LSSMARGSLCAMLPTIGRRTPDTLLPGIGQEIGSAGWTPSGGLGTHNSCISLVIQTRWTPALAPH